jgi:predicted CXXCH cytochrome family protein
MKFKIKNIFLLILLSSFLQLHSRSNSALAQTEPANKFVLDSTIIANFPSAEQNEYCLKCHGNDYYFLEDTVNNVSRKRIMCSNYRISREAFYQANHRSFACIDCHSEAFTNFPHQVENRMQEHGGACIDCHGGDENFAKYHFEEIQADYEKSTHHSITGFSCWKCHNPHSYKITARTNGKLREIIKYDNNICLECHAKFDNYKLLTEHEEINIINKHEWLPNQVAHFSSVRCIECHTRINDSILVSHELLPKKDAVRRCTECHSTDSRLMATLYKFQSKERRKTGFINGVIVNESFVIAANRNVYLNYLSILFFGLVVLVIIVHVYFRIKKVKNGGNH